MGLINLISDPRTVRAVVNHVEPMLSCVEVQDSHDPKFSAVKARRKSAEVLGRDPFLLGVLEGAIFGFVNFLGGNLSEKRRGYMQGKAMISLFPGSAEGLDKITLCRLANVTTAEYRDGCEKGFKLVSYGFGADYSRDPDAAAAISCGRKLENLAIDCIPAHKVGGERDELIDGMMWMYFTSRLTEGHSKFQFFSFGAAD